MGYTRSTQGRRHMTIRRFTTPTTHRHLETRINTISCKDSSLCPARVWPWRWDIRTTSKPGCGYHASMAKVSFTRLTQDYTGKRSGFSHYAAGRFKNEHDWKASSQYTHVSSICASARAPSCACLLLCASACAHFCAVTSEVWNLPMSAGSGMFASRRIFSLIEKR